MPNPSPPPSPPKFAERLINALVREELTEEILGNLYEFYHHQPKQFTSKLSFWYQVLAYLRPSTLKHIPSLYTLNDMNHLNLRIALRSLWKNRTYSLLNLAGFTLGLVCFILLFFHIQSELTYDRFHSDKDQIYRVIRESDINGAPYQIGVTSGPYADALPLDFPGSIQSCVRIAFRERIVRYDNHVFQENRFAYADSNFFEFFDFPLAIGDPQTVLANPNSVVLTQEMAQKYFGEEDPIGKTLEVANDQQLLVTGILGRPTRKISSGNGLC